MKNLKIKLKGILVIKIAKLRKEIKAYKERLAEDVLEKQKLIDKINVMQADIRELLLMIPEEERKKWMEVNYERYTLEKKHTKK